MRHSIVALLLPIPSPALGETPRQRANTRQQQTPARPFWPEGHAPPETTRDSDLQTAAEPERLHQEDDLPLARWTYALRPSGDLERIPPHAVSAPCDPW